MLAALQCDGPTVFLEPKLLSESWLEFLGSGGWKTVQYDHPNAPIPCGLPSHAYYPFAARAARIDDLTLAKDTPILWP